MITELESMLMDRTPSGPGLKDRFIYEVILKTANDSGRPEDPDRACRVLPALLAVKQTLGVVWLTILMWKDGLYLRLNPGNASSLREVLALFRKRSSLPDAQTPDWENEPAWVRLVPPNHARGSQTPFQEKWDSLQDLIHRPSGRENVFFYYTPGPEPLPVAALP
jgi:hypothetical protein